MLRRAVGHGCPQPNPSGTRSLVDPAPCHPCCNATRSQCNRQSAPMLACTGASSALPVAVADPPSRPGSWQGWRPLRPRAAAGAAVEGGNRRTGVSGRRCQGGRPATLAPPALRRHGREGAAAVQTCAAAKQVFTSFDDMIKVRRSGWSGVVVAWARPREPRPRPACHAAAPRGCRRGRRPRCSSTCMPLGADPAF